MAKSGGPPRPEGGEEEERERERERREKLEMSPEARAIVARVFEAITEEGITQRDLADRCQTYYQQFTRWNQHVGKVPADILLRVADALGRPIEWFFGREAAGDELTGEERMLLWIVTRGPNPIGIDRASRLLTAHRGDPTAGEPHPGEAPRPGRLVDVADAPPGQKKTGPPPVERGKGRGRPRIKRPEGGAESN